MSRKLLTLSAVSLSALVMQAHVSADSIEKIDSAIPNRYAKFSNKVTDIYGLLNSLDEEATTDEVKSQIKQALKSNKKLSTQITALDKLSEELDTTEQSIDDADTAIAEKSQKLKDSQKKLADNKKKADDLKKEISAKKDELEKKRKEEDARKRAEAAKTNQSQSESSSSTSQSTGQSTSSSQSSNSSVNIVQTKEHEPVQFDANGLLVEEAGGNAQQVINLLLGPGTGFVNHSASNVDQLIDTLTTPQAIYVIHRIEGAGFGQTSAGYAGTDSPVTHKAFVEQQLNRRFGGSVHNLLKKWGTFSYSGY